VRESWELIWSMEDEGSIDLNLGSIMPSYLGIRRLTGWTRDKSYSLALFPMPLLGLTSL
jgi:hypothetical protein